MWLKQGISPWCSNHSLLIIFSDNSRWDWSFRIPAAIPPPFARISTTFILTVLSNAWTHQRLGHQCRTCMAQQLVWPHAHIAYQLHQPRIRWRVCPHRRNTSDGHLWEFNIFWEAGSRKWLLMKWVSKRASHPPFWFLKWYRWAQFDNQDIIQNYFNSTVPACLPCSWRVYINFELLKLIYPYAQPEVKCSVFILLHQIIAYNSTEYTHKTSPHDDYLPVQKRMNKFSMNLPRIFGKGFCDVNMILFSSSFFVHFHFLRPFVSYLDTTIVRCCWYHTSKNLDW